MAKLKVDDTINEETLKEKAMEIEREGVSVLPYV